jgi:protein TonB
MNRSALYTFSIGAHVAVAIVLGALEIRKAHVATAIEIADVKPKEKPSEPPKPPAITPPKPAAAPRRAAGPRPVAAAAAPAPVGNPSFSDLPDFGLALEGGVTGGIPVAVAAQAPVIPLPAPAPAAPSVKPTPKRICPSSSSSPKPKPLSVPQPAYPEAAIASGISGKVRVQLTIDESGKVIETHLLQRLGRDFDEAALAAVRAARFAPATDCGRAMRSTFTVALRFSAG